MEIKSIELSKLVENDWNPNFMTDKEFSTLTTHVKKFGMRQPILVRPKEERFEIIDGAHRARAAKDAGLKSIDCVIIDIDDSNAKTATIAMNQLKGQMDDVSLAKLLESLKKDLKEEEIADLSGIETKRLQALLKFLEIPEDLSKYAETPESNELTITFILTENQVKLVKKALNSIDASNKNFALVSLCKNFLNVKKYGIK